MSNHFYRLVLNVQEELNTEDDPCIETTDYNFQVTYHLLILKKVLITYYLSFQIAGLVKEVKICAIVMHVEPG